ncbi:hypothetical protein F5Y18DRAFT_274646 [Xylariaceae sp. FL1019]|nr:hypothetical protein F5Y18DRAFT_274646 [Xylariaceae sp. FL1019]
MALTFRNAGRLKPEARLGEAIEEFENCLSLKQTASFQSVRTATRSSSPTLREVMQLTAEVDLEARKGAEGSRVRRCFGPRLTKILEILQQFVSIGDIVVGGSQNLIACGVWSLVRVTILTASRYTAYMDKLSELLMDAGRSAPRYQELVAIYSDSKPLQAIHCEYWIVIVQLCRHVVTICNQSSMGKLKSFLGDFDITTYATQLQKQANAIKEQQRLEQARTISKIQSIIVSKVAGDSRRNQLETKAKILQACSTFDYQQPWKMARKCGDALWFRNNEQYQHWRGNAAWPRWPVLLLVGRLGSGKTVLLANVVDDLHLHLDDIVAYFFCRSDQPHSLQARTVIGCLTRQVIDALAPETAAGLPYDEELVIDEAQLHNLYNSPVINARHICFVIDGIEELGVDARREVIGFLTHVRSRVRLKLCISHRLTADIRRRDRFTVLEPYITLRIPENNPDIQIFVESKLASCLEAGELSVNDPAIILDIQEALETGAQGMFLWVALQIQGICAQKTDKDIRTTLADLPKDLPSTFIRVLRQARAAAPGYQYRLLCLIMAAFRPLTTEEIREALGVTPCRPIWDPSTYINDVYAVLASGGSLLVVDEEHKTIHFTHSSVQQFLLGNFGSSGEFKINMKEAHAEMAQIVVTYLNYDRFERQVTTRSPTLLAQAVPQKIITSALPSTSRSRQLALYLLRSKRQPDFDIGKALAEHLPSRKVPDPVWFFQYAKENWVTHTKDLYNGSRNLFPLIQNLLRRGELDTTLPGLSWSIENAHMGIYRSQILHRRLWLSHMIAALGYMKMDLVSIQTRRVDEDERFALMIRLFLLAATFK